MKVEILSYSHLINVAITMSRKVNNSNWYEIITRSSIMFLAFYVRDVANSLKRQRYNPTLWVNYNNLFQLRARFPFEKG